MPAAEALAPDQTYSAEHGLVDEEMVHRLAHAGCQFKADKATGFSHLVTATLGTIYATTLSPFKRSKDSCRAMIATKAQFAGTANWDEEAKKMNDMMMNRKFTGRGNKTLHSFAGQHRASFHSLQRYADHIALEVPNERTRIGYLLDNSKECPEKYVTVAIAAIWLDNSAGSMRNDFERAVAFLLPTEPVKKGRNCDTATISAVGSGATLACS